MLHCDLDSTVPDWIIEYPGTVHVFESLGIDCSCGGKSLHYLCTKQGLDPQAVLTMLTDIICRTSSGDEGVENRF